MLAGVLANDHRKEIERAAQREAANYEAAQRFSLMSEVEQKASTDERERAREDREESDLDAQWTSANANAVQMFIGGVGLIFLGLTVWFAYLAWRETKRSADADEKALKRARTQLREARKANVIAQRNGRAQTRAYLAATSVNVTVVNGPVERDGENIWHLSINGAITNTGASPARSLTLHAQCTWWDSGDVEARAAHTIDYDDITAHATEPFEIMVAAPQLGAGPLDQVIARIVVTIAVDGQDIFGEPLASRSRYGIRWQALDRLNEIALRRLNSVDRTRRSD